MYTVYNGQCYTTWFRIVLYSHKTAIAVDIVTLLALLILLWEKESFDIAFWEDREGEKMKKVKKTEDGI